MKSIKKIPLMAVIIMVVLSFSNLAGLKIAGASVIVGVIVFFTNKGLSTEPFEGSGFDFKNIGAGLKNRDIWLWLALPLVMDAISITVAKLLMPAYIDHVLQRAGVFVSFDKILPMLFQLAFLALGEEIAWRAFFQKQLNKVFPIIPVLLFSSILFAFGHITEGNPSIVAYDVFFVFINSVLYGIIFHKTNNAWVSAISHFAANLFSIIILVFI